MAGPESQDERVTEVAIGLLVREAGGDREVLITRRREGGVLGGFWEFPGGKIEAGEQGDECLKREFCEEVGLRVQPGELLTTVDWSYPHGRVLLRAYLCTYDGDDVENLEVAEHRWVPVGELGRVDFPPANEAIVAAAIAALG